MKKGLNHGRLDSSGNEWTWDKSGQRAGNPHYDLQHPDGSHTNVNPNGCPNPVEVNHGLGDF